MVMCAADKEVGHHIIYAHFPNRFTYRATILRIKRVGLHALDITFFTDSLEFSSEDITVMNKTATLNTMANNSNNKKSKE